MTQKDRLLNYLKLNSTINPLESWQKLGIYRLSDAILRLRKDGHNIKTETVEVNNQFGEACHVAKYVYTEKSWAEYALEAIRGASKDLKEYNDRHEQN